MNRVLITKAQDSSGVGWFIVCGLDWFVAAQGRSRKEAVTLLNDQSARRQAGRCDIRLTVLVFFPTADIDPVVDALCVHNNLHAA